MIVVGFALVTAISASLEKVRPELRCPMINTRKVKSVDNAGVENAEKTRATDVTIISSKNMSTIASHAAP